MLKAKAEEWRNIKSLRAEVAAAEERAGRADRATADANAKLSQALQMVQKLSQQLEVERGGRVSAEALVESVRVEAAAALGASHGLCPPAHTSVCVCVCVSDSA